MTLSEKIRQCKDGVIDNPYQGDHKKVLFVCSAGILRSATAARIYAHKYNTRCAGSEEYALIPVTERLLMWADEVVFVNWYNSQRVCQEFDMEEFDCKVVELNIPDEHEHMAEELVQAFKEQYEDF
jgi:predicted protein tyrosine phosphatase